jgi:nitrate/TMAO reductase-like tetraheme cytochrome c subunit
VKKCLLAIALTCAMVFGFAATALADHSPQFYFDFQTGTGVTDGVRFRQVFPSDFNVTFNNDNGTSPHGLYSQTSAKCGVCHSIHRAPTAGTSSKSTSDFGGTANTSSRYAESTWTAQVSTQLLLRSTAAASCSYCHISSGAKKMFGGDASLLLFGEGENSWNEFYGHTTGCTSCHAVHGANTFGGSGVAGLVLKYQGIKKLGTIPLVVQPEVYSNSPLYANFNDMKNGVVKPAALAAGATPLSAAVTAQCSVCHVNYSPASNQVINPGWMNPNLFQGGSWGSANGSTTVVFVGNTGDPVTALPGYPGAAYTTRTPAPGATPSSWIMAYKNHPLKVPDALFAGAGAGSGATLVPVTATQSLTCQSCHDAPTVLVAGYYVSSFPHYTPGYYKFMTAMDQGAFDTPSNIGQVMLGREGFFNSGFGTARPGKPAVMNDGYCKKCHTTVGTMY